MSTLAYARLTAKREQGLPGTTTSQSPPGVSTYVDAFAALVPAEALTLHAVILSVTTRTANGVTQITQQGTLAWAFYGLLAISMVLYAVPRITSAKWDKLDCIRIFIPPLAFIGWAMLQRATAFDAVFPNLSEAARTVSAVFLGVILGLVAATLAYKADQKEPVTA